MEEIILLAQRLEFGYIIIYPTTAVIAPTEILIHKYFKKTGIANNTIFLRVSK